MKKTGRNRQCFDCGVADVTWASPKLGTFICVTCSDVHRAAGAHITCVKNFTTYLWSPDEVELMRAVGNNRAKEIFRPSSDLSWQPAESKEQKVRQCTKLYGTEKAQLAVKRHIEAATAAAGPGAKAPAQGMGYASQAPDWLGDWPSEKPVANGLASRDVGNDWHDLIDLFPPSAAHSAPPSKGGDAGTPFQGNAMTAKATEHEKDPCPDALGDVRAHSSCPQGEDAKYRQHLVSPFFAPSQCCVAFSHIARVNLAQDFWSSVNWDELLK
ncbi:AGD9 [Symbiodinium natans]|uniref:AGD9 protein n=1 Tax=Symbiodinium natans TaxID=878477 RepID=A0A812MNW1_9DINO|nr:AGD9 [Symbiodinium natans]